MKRDKGRAARVWGGLTVCLLAAAAGASVPDATVACRVELDRGVLPAGGVVSAVLKVTLSGADAPSGADRPPVNLAIVLDRSGSMRGEKLEKAKEAAIEALSRLNGRDLFSLVIYNHTVETVVPAQSAGDTGEMMARIRAIRADGNTALFGGVSQGGAEIRKHLSGDYVHRMILLSDGLANVGPSSPDDLGRLGAGLIKEGISVTTVGVGTDYNEDLMTQLSQKSDGNTYFVQSSADLPRIFEAELGDVLSVVAKRVKLRIECGEGVEPVAILGREGRIRGNGVELYLNQLYGGQEKFALVQVNLPAGQAGQSRDVAVARVFYENPFTRQESSADGQAAVQYSASEKDVQASVNPKVQKAFEINRNAIVQNAAIELADQGKIRQAAEQLRHNADQLREQGRKLNDADLLGKAVDAERKAEMLVENEGLPSASRKAMRADAYQEIHQQTAR